MGRPSKREDIAQAALRQFHARGFNATGISDITAAAGAPKGRSTTTSPARRNARWTR